MRLADRLPRRERFTALAPLVAVPWARARRYQPWTVLVPLVAAQWVAVLVFALSVERNGWLFYQGGDQTWYYTGAWLLSQGELPPAAVGYGWSLLLAPIALFAGPDILAALPAIVLLQTAVLLPVALLCVYGIAASFGGRLLGYAAAGLWVAVPFAVIPLWDERYHDRYVEQFLPQALGLTGLADFPSMVVLLVAAFFVVRSLATRGPSDAVLAGLVTGLAVAIKPANLLFLAGPAAAYLLARRGREAGAFAVALLPALVTLALWKQLGLGQVPALSLPEARLAGAEQVAVSLPGPLGRYVDPDWDVFHRHYLELREYFWTVRILQWLPLAGLIAVARRSLPTAGLLAGWFAAFVVAKGGFVHASVPTGTLFRFLMPAFPAYFLLAAAIPLLLPEWGPRIAERFSPEGRQLVKRRLVLAAGAVLLVLVPLVAVVAARPLPAERAVFMHTENTLLPVDGRFEVQAFRKDASVRLAWDSPAHGSATFYRILRAPAGEDLRCDPGPRAATWCYVEMEPVATTRATEWTGVEPAGAWTYRVGLAANWRDDPELGDVLVLSLSATPPPAP
jgi:hypothetical protein